MHGETARDILEVFSSALFYEIQPAVKILKRTRIILHSTSFKLSHAAEHVLPVLADRDRHRDRADGDGVAGGGGAGPRGDRAAGAGHGHAPLRRLLRAAREGEAEEGRQQSHSGRSAGLYLQYDLNKKIFSDI